nr:hypothetical protein [Tanacetum cinerariifolium]GFB81336.1 hypothetical protein [Tanacetum cinerariifolium]
TISESSLRRHLKLNDEEGISSLPDAELFENLSLMGEGSANPTKPHHTPSPQEQHSSHHDSLPPSHLTKTSEPIPQAPTETLTSSKYTRRAILMAQCMARQGNIAKTSALPHESSLRVTSLDADEGMPKKRKLQELIDAQVAKEIEEDFAREDQRLSEQLTRDSEIARLHAE